jgi:methylated-DNA-[protein]-cysteine S-methyltransferase
LVAEADSLVAIAFDDPDHRDAGAAASLVGGAEPVVTHPVLDVAVRQLLEYFAGERSHFDLPLRPRGSRFQQRVWAALLDIPYGQTRSYGDVAREIGFGPQASRAVGLANGANPIPIVIPCHRVIGADGSLTGYGGGLDRKRALLDLERGSLF